MPQQEGTSGFEHLTKNIFARIGTVVTGVAGVASALYQLTRDITLTLEGLALVIAIVVCGFVLVWRTKKVQDDKEVVVFFYARLPRLVAGGILLVAAIFAIAYGVGVANLVIERDHLEKELAAIPFLTLTPHPTATPMPGAAQTATASERTAWPLILTDSFTSNGNGWRIGFTDYSFATTNRTIANGKYRMEMNSTTSPKFSSWGTPNLRPVSDVFATVDAQRVSGPTSAGYGIYFRMSADQKNYYVFHVSDERDAVLESYGDSKSTQLARLEQVAAIKPGEVNRLGIVAQGTHLEAFVNDQLITSVDDDRWKEGSVAFWSGYLGSNTQAVVEFSNFQVRAPTAVSANAPATPLLQTSAAILAQPNATVPAREAALIATRPAILTAIDPLLANARIAFASGEGTTGGRRNGNVSCFNSRVNLKNFVVEATFFNPADAKVNPWDYGFVFREVGTNRQYWLQVGWDAAWILFYPKLNPDGSLLTPAIYSRGTIGNWDGSASGSNQLRAVIYDKLGYLFVNNAFVATLDVSDKNDSGNVGLCTAMTATHDFPGLVVHYKDFIVSSLP